MFHLLHRIYVVAGVTFVCGGLMWFYPRSGLAEPLADWYAVWRNPSETSAKPVGELSGMVIKVLDSTSFTVLGTDRRLYNIGLFGVIVPRSKSGSSNIEQVSKAKKGLSDLVLSNEVRITLTWIDPQRRGMGVVHVGETNVNAAMVQSGFVSFKRDAIRGLPLWDQYALMRADRKAKEQADEELK